ncbi:MAG: hypothetical protein IPG57_07555 [Burkholderiales bacterium]|jgi:phage tail protein X|nr:hypothetical protein [Burkholderiales bacterium]
MRLTTLSSTEKSLDDLVDRLYPNLSGQKRKQVTSALLKENPQLSAAQPLRPGGVIKVPTRAVPQPKVAGLTNDPVEDLRASLKGALSGYQELLAQRIEQGIAEAARQEDLLNEKDIASAIKSSKEAPDLAKQLSTLLKKRKKTLMDEMKSRAELFALIEKDLDASFD